MKFASFLVICIIVFVFSDTCAQEAWLDQRKKIIESMNLDYTKPKDLIEIPVSECFKAYPLLEELFTCVSDRLISKDKQIIVFFHIYKIFGKQDSIDMKKMMPGGTFDVIDKMHAFRMRNHIRLSEGASERDNWKAYVSYYSNDDAKLKFNADTAVVCPIKIDRNNYYEGKYKNVKSLYLQKKGFGFIAMDCLYTDAAAKHFPKYWQMVESIFRYRN